MTKPWIALGWTPGQLTGWGTFGAGFARSLTEAGYEVLLPAGLDPSGLLPLDRPALQQLVKPMPEDRDGWLFMPLGNDLPAKPEFPSHVKIAAFCVFEDTGALTDEAVERLKGYDVLLAPSRWTQGVLQAKGLPSLLFHQGYDDRVFFPDPNAYSQWNESAALVGQRGSSSPFAPEIYEKWRSHRPTYVFSGGKLEFRKGQDIVIEAFKRFRETPEGKDAVLVVAWDNPWPRTMDGIWLSGYVQGVPTVKQGKADIVSWLEVNGVPRDAVIDCGRLTAPEMAQVLRSVTIGVFPSRCESATNLVLVEALASGLPCIVSEGHGHNDAPEAWRYIHGSGQVRGDCSLYKSVDGWTEARPGDIVDALVLFARTHPVFTGTISGWSWSVRGPAIVEQVLANAPVAA